VNCLSILTGVALIENHQNLKVGDSLFFGTGA
jgi:hypothetical protein